MFYRDTVPFACFCVAALSIVPQGIAVAQKPASKLSKPQSSTYSTQALDVTRETLPGGYLGNDASAVFSSLLSQSASLTKSDFETSAVFMKRQGEFASTSFFHGMRPVDLFCFRIIPTVSYDADSGILTVMLNDAGSYYGLDGMGFAWKQSRVPAGSYIGTNDFGVKRTIQRIRETDTVIGTDQPNWFLADYVRHIGYQDETGFQIKMNSDEARHFSHSLAAILIGSLSPPFLTQDHSQSEATVSHPIELSMTVDNLNIMLRAIWLYNVVTGEVVKKYNTEEYMESWPLRVKLHCFGGDECPNLLEARVDGKEISRTSLLFETGGLVKWLYAHDSIHIKASTVAESRLAIVVTQDGKPLEWVCKEEYRGSAGHQCTIDLVAK